MKKTKDKKIRLALKSVLVKNKFYKLKDISNKINIFLNNEISKNYISTKLKSLTYMPENVNVKDIHGDFYVYYEDENQKNLIFKIKQRIIFNIYKQRVDESHKYEIYDDINREEVSLMIDLSIITDLFLKDLKIIDDSGDIESVKELFKRFDMDFFLSKELNKKENSNFYKSLAANYYNDYLNIVNISNSVYLKDNNETLFENPVEDINKSQKKIKTVYATSALLTIFSIIIFKEQFFVYCMYLLIPIYYLLSKKTIFKIILLGSFYKIISNLDIAEYLSLFGSKTDNYIIPDLNILFLSFLISNFLTNHSYFFMKNIKNMKSLFFIIIQFKLINSNLWMIKRNVLNIRSNLLLYVKNFCEKHEIDVKVIKENKEESIVVEKIKKITGFNINSDIIIKNPHFNITVLNSFCTLIVIYMLINLILPTSINPQIDVAHKLQYVVKKQYAEKNDGYCKDENISDDLLIIKLKNGTVLAEENETFKEIKCNRT